MQRLHDLKLALGHLLSEGGSVESPVVGLAVNLGLALVGVIVWWATTGVPSLLGGGWAILNLLGILKWVLQL